MRPSFFRKAEPPMKYQNQLEEAQLMHQKGLKASYRGDNLTGATMPYDTMANELNDRYHELVESLAQETTVNRLLRLVRFYGEVHHAKVAFKKMAQTIQSESEARINATLDDLELAAAQDITTTPNADAVFSDPRASDEMRFVYGHARKVSAERGIARGQSAKERLEASLRACTRAENATWAAGSSTFDYANGIPERYSPETSLQGLGMNPHRPRAVNSEGEAQDGGAVATPVAGPSQRGHRRNGTFGQNFAHRPISNSGHSDTGSYHSANSQRSQGSGQGYATSADYDQALAIYLAQQNPSGYYPSQG